MRAFRKYPRHSGALATSERTRNIEVPWCAPAHQGSRYARPETTWREHIGSSSRLRFLGQRRKGLAFGGETLEQRGRFERGIVGLLGVVGETVGDVLETDLVGIEHRAAAIDRPAVTIKPDHVDVARPRCNALFEDARPLIDHRVHHAFEDFVVADDALLAA